MDRTLRGAKTTERRITVLKKTEDGIEVGTNWNKMYYLYESHVRNKYDQLIDNIELIFAAEEYVNFPAQGEECEAAVGYSVFCKDYGLYFLTTIALWEGDDKHVLRVPAPRVRPVRGSVGSQSLGATDQSGVSPSACLSLLSGTGEPEKKRGGAALRFRLLMNSLIQVFPSMIPWDLRFGNGELIQVFLSPIYELHSISLPKLQPWSSAHSFRTDREGISSSMRKNIEAWRGEGKCTCQVNIHSQRQKGVDHNSILRILFWCWRRSPSPSLAFEKYCTSSFAACLHS
nr:hypothetical protein Iba_chr07fCG1570 [Ipomoea batatas]